jgi:D-glycerate 3-kinase
MIDRAHVETFARAGPAWPQIDRLGPVDWTAWSEAADRLGRALSGAADLDRRIHHLYLPVWCFCLARLRAASARPLVVGLQAPQGAGKTTLGSHLQSLCSASGLTAASVSVDDFYLTRAEQLRLAADHPGNPYFEHRGYPGTHDVALGVRTLDALKALGAGQVMMVPAYDKSAHAGRGDRAPESAWRGVTGPVDLLIIEGWMLGFEPVPDERLADPMLLAPNHALAAYARWHDRIDAFVVLRAEDDAYVLRWRIEAEETMKARGVPGLSRDAITDYVRRFLPAYALWAGRPPSRFEPDATLSIGLDALRRPVDARLVHAG